MDRIENLVNKLKEQADQGADARQLLVTVQILQQELAQMVGSSRTLGTSKVAVMLPAANVPPAYYERYAPKPAETAAPATAAQPAKPGGNAQAEAKEEKQLFTLDMPAEEAEEPARPEAGFDPMLDIPTLSQQVQEKQPPSSLPAASLNDRLKQEKGELQQFLKDVPVKDLRKAVGINDRFLFINELFRGDEAMYERSIKTINSFNIYPEAEYWITRELKTKLGWDNDSETVMNFDQLVKRRFS